MQYIPMLTKKEPSDILIQKICSSFYCSFPPFIENGKLTTLGVSFSVGLAVGLAVGCATRIIRCFLKHD